MTDRQSIRQTLIELIEADTGEKVADLGDSMNIKEELGRDTVDVVSIVSQIERRYRIRLSHEELVKLTTAGDVLDMLEKKLAGPSAESSAA